MFPDREVGARLTSSPKKSRYTRAPGIDLDLLARLAERIDPEVFDAEPEFDIVELAEFTGWTVPQLEKLWLWAGFPQGTGLDKKFTRRDAESIRDLYELSRTENLDAETIGSMVRAIGTSMERLAVWQVESHIQFLADRDHLGDTEARLAAAALMPTIGRKMMSQIASIWLLHYSAAVHRLTVDTVLQRGVSDDDYQFPLVRAVGCAEIRDFSKITQHMSKAKYMALVQEFQNRVHDIVRTAGGRTNKNIGDGIYFVTDDIGSGAEIALKLAKMQEEGFGAAVNVGLTWCRIMTAYGNIGGPGVDLAMLLARETPANEVYIDNDGAALLAKYPKYYTLTPTEVNPPGRESIMAYRLSPAE